MSTTDDRLRRMTELARKCWPGASVYAYPESVEVHSRSSNEGTVKAYALVEHERALDMLESALLVGAGELSPAEHAMHAITNELSTLALTWQHAAITAGNAELAELHERHADAVRKVLLAARAIAMTGGVGG